MTERERESFRAAVSEFERVLGAEVDRLGRDVQRLRGQGNPRFAAELLELRERMHRIRVYAVVVLGARAGSSAKAPPLPIADVDKPEAP